MKKISLNGPTADNLGQFCDAGAELIVSDSKQAGHISRDRAQDLLSRHSAHAIAETKVAKPAPAKSKANASAAAKVPAPAPKAAPAPAPDTGEAAKPDA